MLCTGISAVALCKNEVFTGILSKQRGDTLHQHGDPFTCSFSITGGSRLARELHRNLMRLNAYPRTNWRGFAYGEFMAAG